MSEPAPTRRRMSAAQRRAGILEAAQDVFATEGYHGASLDDIAAAAGISKALIYEHFDSKQALHATLVQEHADELFARLAANAASGLEGEARLRGGIDAFLGFVEERREAWRALFRDAADPDVRAVLDRLEAQATRAMGELIGAGAEEDEIAARLLSGGVQALANWWYDHQDVPRAVLVDRVIGLAWHGIEGIRP